MTIPEALIVATSTNRQLYALEYQNCEATREAALDLLATELERVSRVAGEYIETDPEYIGSGCVDALVIHAEHLRERAKRAEEDGRLLSAQYGAACMQYESTLAGLKADLERQSTMDMQMTVLMGELAASHAEKERNAACTERDESLTNEYRVDLVRSNLIANNLRDERDALKAEVERLRAVPCACPCHDVAGHADALEMDRDHYRGRAIAAEERVVYYVGLARKAEQERDALKAEIARLAPLLAIYGWGGCTMDEIEPAEPGAAHGREDAKEKTMAKRTDTERLDELQRITTGRVICRWSTTKRGWRLHETIRDGALLDVRDAIDRFLSFEVDAQAGTE